MMDTISLSQKIYLLSIHPKKGGIVGSAQSALNYILIGAVLLELSMDKKIEFVNKKIVVKNSKSSNPLHQFLLKKLAKSKRELKISIWISKLTFSAKHIKREVRNELLKKRVIRVVQKRFIFFSWQQPEILNFQLLYKLLAKIDSEVFKGTKNPEDLVLLSLIIPAGLLKRIFPEKEKRKRAKQKLNVLLNKNQLSLAVKNAIAASNAVLISIGILNAGNSAVGR